MAEKLLRLLLTAALLCAFACGALAETADIPSETVDASGALPEEYAEYKKVAESYQYILYLYEPQVSILLQDKETGTLVASTLNDHTAQGKLNKTWTGYTYSGVVLDVLTGTSKNYKQADLVNTEHTLEYTYAENGFTARIYFAEYGLGLDMQVTLDDDELLVTVPDASIREDIKGTYMATVSLYPLFGATYMDQRKGYMFVPDGCGALIHLTDKESRFTTGYSQPIYGTDAGFTERNAGAALWDTYETVLSPHQVIAPVFGMAHTDDGVGYIAVVEQGEKRCSIEAHPNGVMRVSYNRCFAKFLLRDVYKQPMNQSGSTKIDMLEKDRTHHDLAVRYLLLAGDEVSYMGMAARYRAYLLDQHIISRRDTSYATRLDFLGADQEKFLVSTRAVTMTTADDMRAICDDLRGAGVASVVGAVKGWQSGGVNALPVSAWHVDSAVGGGMALRSLILDAAEQNYRLAPYVDALRMNAATNTFAYDAAKMINKTTLQEKNTKQVYNLFYYLLPDKAADRLVSLAADLKRNGIPALAVGGITDNLFSYSLKDTFYTRNDGAEHYTRALTHAAADLWVALEEPFQYEWPYMSAFFNMPLDTSDYMYIDEEVPFLPLVLKGIVPMYSDYVNFEANKTEQFLKLAETGVYPSFYITKENSSALIYTNSNDLYSTQFSAYRDTIIDYDRQLRALAEGTADAVIIRHEKLDGDVRRVTYSNGFVVLVNYSGTDAEVDGVTVPARSWKAGEAK